MQKKKGTTPYLLMKSLWKKNRKKTLIGRMDLKLRKICQDKESLEMVTKYNVKI
jgi:hypothetical protein